MRQQSRETFYAKIKNMAYIIIHEKTEVQDCCILETIERHIKKGFHSFEEILKEPDFHILEKEEKGSIKIEQVKQLQKKLLYSPFHNSHQFGIIKNAHLMTTEAQNALLKTLEECQEKTILILTVNNERAVLQTILSRCTRIYPREIKKEFLKEADFTKEEDFLNMQTHEKMIIIDEVIKEKKVEEFLNNLIVFFRNKHTQKIEQGSECKKEADILKMLIQAKTRITGNVNTRIALEYICFKINHT